MHTIRLDGGNEIRYKLKNARVIELYTDSINVVEIKNKSTQQIEKVVLGDIEISVGSQFKHDYECIPSEYPISKIEKGADSSVNYKHRYTLFSHLRNKTTTYILPCLGEDCGYFDVDGYLINAYLDKGFTKLYLVYRFAKTDYYSDLETRLLKHSGVLRIHNSPGDYDIYEFDIPDGILQDVRLFEQGKYSKFSEQLKLKIRKFHNLTNKSHLWKVLTKDKDLISTLKESLGIPLGFYWNVDLDSKPNLKDEIWNF